MDVTRRWKRKYDVTRLYDVTKSLFLEGNARKIIKGRRFGKTSTYWRKSRKFRKRKFYKSIRRIVEYS